jgi:L-fuconolactonase
MMNAKTGSTRSARRLTMTRSTGPGPTPAYEPFHPLARPSWLALTHEEVIDPAQPIIDPHHHLWDRADSRYLLDELLADTGDGHNVVATVFVQCRQMYRAGGDPAMAPLGETEFVNGVAAMSASGRYGPTRLCQGIVGFADLTAGAAVAPLLRAHLACAGGRFRGIRHGAACDADPEFVARGTQPPAGLLRDPKFRQGFALLAEHGLSFDAWVYHPQIGDLTDLARAFPGTAIVLDHVGGPIGIAGYAGRRDPVFNTWRADIIELARCPNVRVKLGGLGMRVSGFDWHKQSRPPSSDELAQAWRPYIDTCIDAFGVERCMFESNFPVDKLSCSYRVLWNAFKRLAGGASAADRNRLFHDNAADFYRLGQTRQPA